MWFVVFALLLVTERALRSRVGRALRALSSSETAASTLGVRAAGWKLQAFVISAAMAGLAGGFFAYAMSAVVYSSFTGQLSLVVMIMVLVGGVSSLAGAVIGAIIMSWLQYAFTGFATYQTALYALVLLLLLLFLPGGLIMGFESRHIKAARAYVRRRLEPVTRRIPGFGPAARGGDVVQRRRRGDLAGRAVRHQDRNRGGGPTLEGKLRRLLACEWPCPTRTSSCAWTPRPSSSGEWSR